MNIQKAIALVTGGSSGIGLATAQLLREKGAQVAICGRDQPRLEQAARTCGALPIIADVGSETDVARMIATVVREFGDFNVLINNAGFGQFSPLAELDLTEFQHVMATNVTGAMLAARESARHFIKRNYGNIINIASTAAHRGFAGGTAYVASKFALTGMTECWRAELRTSNVRVMQVNPSEVLTRFATSAGRAQKESRRKLVPEDIAHAIASMLELEDRGFVTDLTVWATNPD